MTFKNHTEINIQKGFYLTSVGCGLKGKLQKGNRQTKKRNEGEQSRGREMIESERIREAQVSKWIRRSVQPYNSPR